MPRFGHRRQAHQAQFGAGIECHGRKHDVSQDFLTDQGDQRNVIVDRIPQDVDEPGFRICRKGGRVDLEHRRTVAFPFRSNPDIHCRNRASASVYCSNSWIVL
jgi:hypothetical protein